MQQIRGLTRKQPFFSRPRRANTTSVSNVLGICAIDALWPRNKPVVWLGRLLGSFRELHIPAALTLSYLDKKIK
jgi:hypothetical protein